MLDIQKLPSSLQTDVVEKWYSILEEMFQEFRIFSSSAISDVVVKTAQDSALNVLGGNLVIPRGSLSTEVFRQKLLVYYNSFFMVPTLTNFTDLIKNSMGYYPENVVAGWQEGIPLKLSMDVVIPVGSTDALLQDLKSVFSLGHELDAAVLYEAYVHNQYTSDEQLTGLDSIHQDIERTMVGFKGRKVSAYTGNNINTGLTINL